MRAFFRPRSPYRGRRTSVTDANNKTTTYAYDDADRLTSVTDAANQTTSYAYDTEDNLTSITDALNRTTSFTYDSQSRLTRTTFPSTLYETYAWTNFNMTSKTDRRGKIIYYWYDNLDRLTTKQYSGVSGNYDYAYDLNSRLTQVSGALANGTYTFTYDRMGRLTGTNVTYPFLSGQSFPISYTYDAASNRVSMTDPQNGVTQYAGACPERSRGNNLNRLTSITDPQSQVFGFSYDALNRRTQLTRPNGVNTNYTYDNLSRLLSILHQVSGVTIDGVSYAVDNAGNRTSRTALPANTIDNYTYDAIYQLTQVVQGGNTTESYAYDAVGNRTSSHLSASYTVNSSNQLTATSNATYTYDNNGNTVTKVDSAGTTTYGWDHENRLTSVTLPGSGGTVSFKYNPFGRRVQKSSPSATVTYLHDDANILAEYDGSGTQSARYVQGQGVDEPLAIVRGGVTSYYEADGLGSITSLTNSTASTVATYTSDNFGRSISSSGTATNPFRYTAREWDAESDLYYYRARYYSPDNGRFLSEDPVLPQIRASDELNAFAYVRNNPALNIDPLGLESGAAYATDYRALGGAPSTPGSFPFNIYGSYCGPLGNASIQDDIDQICFDHDKCYERAGASYTDNLWPGASDQKRTCMLKCDQELCDRLWAARPRGWYARFMRRAILSYFKCYNGGPLAPAPVFPYEPGPLKP